MTTIAAGRVRVGSVAELQSRGCTVVSAGGHGIAVFAHDGRFYAVDNRCPHMGFPLSRGTVRDGLLTCHWHHARFDLEGGGTLDPFADNVRSFPLEVEDDAVFVIVDAGATDGRSVWMGRLEEGLEHGLEFVLAKAMHRPARQRDAGAGDRAHRRALRPPLPRPGLGHGHDHPDLGRHAAAGPAPETTAPWRSSTARCAWPRTPPAAPRASSWSRCPPRVCPGDG